MKISIRDKASLLSVAPIEAAFYLKATGWQQTKLNHGNYSIWHNTDPQNEEYEIALVMSKDRSDFVLSMSEMLKVLEAFEQRSQMEIYNDLMVTSTDVIRVRLGSGEAAEDTIPFEEGVQSVEKARELILAAACAAVQPRPVFPKRKPDRAMDYLRKIRLGQTERGSYVLTIYSRVPPRLGQLDSFEDEPPFERRVTKTLIRSLIATKCAAEKANIDEDVQAFRNAVPDGVSANLCEALVGLVDFHETQRSVEVSLTWSRSRPEPMNIPNKVVVPTDYVPILAEVVRIFKESEPQEDFQLIGQVVKLERDSQSPVGKVTIQGWVEEKARRITLELDGSDYDIAVKAHTDRVNFSCNGILIREGSALVLKNHSNISIIP
ncbi:MAG: hypothetical protein HQK60_17640 [Deltaproteobacteria bacterium]|nr:hypothetical protein [Deltaproteobacteria bacterium]